MEHRRLGKTGYDVSVIGFGSWAIGDAWGDVDDATSLAALHAAVEAGVRFVDTADVYGDGRSERLVAKLRREVTEPIVVATKAGRRAPEQRVEHYRPENLVAWVDRSRENLEMETLDLLQLHCPPTDLFYHPEVFAALDDLVASGRVAHYGVSVERVEEALKAIDYPGVATVQIIYNVFRQRPAERFFPAARAADVGVIVRVPLASGLLTGKFTADTTFAANDHRNYNRHGEAFDVGETFSGVDLDTGLAAVAEVARVVPDGETMAELALRYCFSDPAVSTVIPGAKTPAQARANAAAGSRPPLDPATLERLAAIYRERIAPEVHYRW
ncbi:MAG TPA: aldo/keto reductase [Acidimicrobiales bacterium]|nr:aldo/keto reductase [Acidimicrobiales bacterium]